MGGAFFRYVIDGLLTVRYSIGHIFCTIACCGDRKIGRGEKRERWKREEEERVMER